MILRPTGPIQPVWDCPKALRNARRRCFGRLPPRHQSMIHSWREVKLWAPMEPVESQRILLQIPWIPHRFPPPNLTFRPSYKVRAVEAHCCWCPSSCFSCSIFLWQRNPRNGHWNWENHRTIAVRFSGHGKKTEGSWPKFDDLKDGSIVSKLPWEMRLHVLFLPWQLLWIACSIPPLFCIHKPLTLSLNTPRPQNFATPDLQLD